MFCNSTGDVCPNALSSIIIFRSHASRNGKLTFHPLKHHKFRLEAKNEFRLEAHAQLQQLKIVSLESIFIEVP